MFSTFAVAPAPRKPNSASPWGSRRRMAIHLQQPAASAGTNGSLASASAKTTKPKRIQVSRACDWCRVHRIKCNSIHPCQNCQARGVPCSNNDAPLIHTLPQAFREIEKLRKKVKELEDELGSSSRNDQNQHDAPSKVSGSDTPVTTTTTTTTTTTSIASLVSSPASVTSTGLGTWPVAAVASSAAVSRRRWVGVYASPDSNSNTRAKQFFGPSSLVYFIKWMEDFLVTTLQQPEHNRTICLDSAETSLASPISEGTSGFATDPASASASSPRSEDRDRDDAVDEPPRAYPPLPRGPLHAQEPCYLTTTQEEYFLGLFWQSYHNSMQIVNEHAFREHYRSLCGVPGSSRKPSALVDIIMAICMQYGIARLPPHERNSARPWCSGVSRSPERSPSASASGVLVTGAEDASISGRAYYHRSQSLLVAQLEAPTVATLQCNVLSVIYLSNASLQTAAHTMLGLAVRTAQILGLHLDPEPSREDSSYDDRELRRRIWWSLQTLEIKTCMKLGRPLTAPVWPEACCPLPSDDYQLALLSSSTTSMSEGVTWLTYTVQNTKLVLSAYATHAAFFDRCDELLTENGGATIYEDPRVLEDCAAFLQSRLQGPQGVQLWLCGLPEGLRSRRKGGGVAYSTDCSPLEMEPFVPAWLQRQRLLLELLYHHLLVNLFRPFISFPSSFPSSLPSSLLSIFPKQETSSVSPSFSGSSTSPPASAVGHDGMTTPLARQNAHTCVRHAMALTSMIHEALRSTEHLGGWYEAFQWQWDAAITLIGFLLSDPATEEIHRDARRTIDLAIEVFDIFGGQFAMGTSAASVTRDLAARVDRQIEGRRQAVGSMSSIVSSGSSTSSRSDGAEGLGFEPKAPGVVVAEVPFDEIMIEDGDTVRSLLEDTINTAYGLDSFGGMDFSLIEAGDYFDGWDYSNTVRASTTLL